MADKTNESAAGGGGFSSHDAERAAETPPVTKDVTRRGKPTSGGEKGGDHERKD